MILLEGAFPFWALLVAGMFGVTTALAIGGIIAGGLASAGTTAVAIKNAIEGHWPWDDFEAWALDLAKGASGGLGSVISAAQGEPTIMGALAGEGGGTSREGGTGGVLQGATGQAASQAVAEMHGQTPGQMAQGGGRPQTSGLAALANRYPDDGQPSRSDIFKSAAKSIGTGFGQQVAGVGVGGLTAGLSGLAQGAGQAIGGAAGQALQQAPSALTSALEFVRQIPQAIGPTATGILQQTITGAGLGAAGSALQGGNPGVGAASGAAGGLVGGLANLGAAQFQPGMQASFQPTSSMGPSLLNQAPVSPFHLAMQQGSPTFASVATKPAPSILGGLSSSIVNQAMTPQPGMPEQSPYQHRLPYWQNPYSGGF